MSRAMDVWVYQDAHGCIVKTQPFAMVPVSAPGSYRPRLELQQGVHMHLPCVWDWVEQKKDRWYAGLGAHVYDVTDVKERCSAK